ncbi:MAG: hypothetical protein R3C14_10300 [Caldilineaceae bacterium]
MPQLQIQLLGHFAITYQDAPLTAFTSPRLQSFLAYLLLHTQTLQSRHHLAFHLWPDSTEAQAHSNLRKAIHQLRAALSLCRLWQRQGKRAEARDLLAVVLWLVYRRLRNSRFAGGTGVAGGIDLSCMSPAPLPLT